MSRKDNPKDQTALNTYTSAMRTRRAGLATPQTQSMKSSKAPKAKTTTHVKTKATKGSYKKPGK
jgi:hypothetical protein